MDMGPPPVPEKGERATDLTQLADLVNFTGIDLAAEEALLSQYDNQSLLSLQNSSYDVLAQSSFGSHAAFRGTGPLSEEAVSQNAVEQELWRRHERRARERAEKSTKHLHNPFLNAQAVRSRLDKFARSERVRINFDGLFDKTPDPPKPPQVSTTVAMGPDGTGLVATRARTHSWLEPTASLVDVLTIISIATQERLRSVLEDALEASRIRRFTSDGVVDPAFADIATGPGEATPTTTVPRSITGTAWDAVIAPDSAVSPMTKVPTKGPLEDAEARHPRLPTPPTDPPLSPRPTIQFDKNPIYDRFNTLSKRDLEVEEARLNARRKRQKLAAATPNDASTPAPGTPGAAGTSTPTTEMAPPKMTKKERDKIAKQNQTEEVLHRAAIQTASMALGGKAKKYSWLNSAATGPTPMPGRLDTAAAAGRLANGVGAPGAVTAKPKEAGTPKELLARNPKWGEWKEDGPRGKRVQLQDFLEALEMDGKEGKSAAKAVTMLKQDR